MSITIKDIARILNVSHTTVSRALNDSLLISEDTKAKVKKVAQKYNYSPNVNARSLVLSKSHNIGLFFSTLQTGTSAGFFLESVRGVNEIIKGQYSLSVEGVDDFNEYSKISPRFFDGIILMSQSQEDDTFIEHVISQEIPFILLNREFKNPSITTILADDKTGAFNATNCLIKKGHKKIGIIEGKSEFKNTHRRKEGYMEALNTHGLKHDKRYAFNGNYDLDGGYHAMLNILSSKDLTPALTTVSRPIEKMCTEGARILMDKIDGNYKKNISIFLKTELKERDSVRNLS